MPENDSWERQALLAAERYRCEDPSGYVDYIAELEEVERLDSPATDPWDDESTSTSRQPGPHM